MPQAYPRRSHLIPLMIVGITATAELSPARVNPVMAQSIDDSGDNRTIAGQVVENSAPGEQSDQVDFTRDVAPILQRHCSKCHGSESREGGLRLTSHEDLLTPNESGASAVIVGRSKDSPLIHRITSNDPDERMPSEAKPLSGAEINILRNWIDGGAHWPNAATVARSHWSYQKPVRPDIPQVAGLPQDGNAIDVFVRARLANESSPVSPAPPENPARLLRRLFLDLTGLPPTPAQVDEFLKDPSTESYARFADQLLSSPRYGEKWAQQWLDLARYADSNGYQADQFRSIWAYRDWVIEAFNSDMPFDQFTIEQLAGDLLPEASVDQRIATGFHRCTTCNVEAGVDPEENRTNQVADRVNTTATVWLGTTLECARCHNHKYDPFTQQDYYQLFAFFNNTPLEVEPPTGGVQFEVAGPIMALPIPDERRQQYLQLQEQLKAAKVDAAQPDATKAEKAKVAKLEKTLKQIEPPVTAVMTEMDQPRESFIFKRGDFLTHGAAVVPSTPAALHSFVPDESPDRLDFARWLVSADNPLVARVTVNRWWAEFFGRGLVPTLEDFGIQGDRPSHPELLDWLATEFMEHNWSMKHIHKQIVMSATYRQSSRVTAAHREHDPFNILLTRAPRVRLSAETIRDNALAISGRLSEAMGGPPIYPPQPDGIWRHVGRNAPVYGTNEDHNRYRRGIYVVWRRSAPYPGFVNFDAPDRASCVPQRSRTNTPLQALTLLNDTAYVELAHGLSQRVLKEWPDGNLADRLQHAFRLCVSREPSPDELGALTELWQSTASRYSNDIPAAELLITDKERVPSETVANQAAWFTVANVLLNLDETITKN